MKCLAPLLCLAVWLMASGPAAAVEVGAILKSPGAYVHEKVEVEGIVEKLIGDTGKSTAFYLVKDDFGDAIRVRSAEGHPKAGKRYRITGVISIHSNSKEPYISETKRILQDQPVAAAPAPALPTPEEEDDTALIVGLVILGIALVGVAGFLASRQKAEGGAAGPALSHEDTEEETDESDEPDAEPAAAAAGTEVFETSTIKIELSPATMKFMPGAFEILSGEEKGQKIRIQGYPTADGAETTIGREEIAGDRRFAHVQLKQPTVSRQQAKLVAKGGKYHLINMGSTNPSQVNGRELAVDESVELEPGDTVRFGEVELRFEA